MGTFYVRLESSDSRGLAGELSNWVWEEFGAASKIAPILAKRNRTGRDRVRMIGYMVSLSRDYFEEQTPTAFSEKGRRLMRLRQWALEKCKDLPEMKITLIPSNGRVQELSVPEIKDAVEIGMLERGASSMRA
jgi:hypothetical protein